jgi:hypothetical protein
MHPGPPRKKHCASARDHRYRRRHSGLPCAVGYGLLRALLGELCLIATVAVMRPLEPHDSLTPSLSAPEPHDFIRPRRCRSPHGTDPSTTFRATSAAIARRPLFRGGTNATIRQIRISEKMNILRAGVDRSFARPLVGQISCRTTPLAPRPSRSKAAPAPHGKTFGRHWRHRHFECSDSAFAAQIQHWNQTGRGVLRCYPYPFCSCAWKRICILVVIKCCEIWSFVCCKLKRL